MRKWCAKVAASLIPGQEVLKFAAETPFRFRWDDEMLKLALQIAINSHWTYIPTPDDLAKFPSLWLTDLFRLNEEVTIEYNMIKGSLTEE